MSLSPAETMKNHGGTEDTETAPPDRWPRVRLGDHVTKIGSGVTPSGGQTSYLRNGIPLIRSQNVHMNRFDRAGLAFLSKEQDAEMAGSRVRPADVLLNITGASIGRVCVVPTEYTPSNVNQHVCIIRSDGSWHPPFLSFYLSTPAFQRFIMEDQAGGTRQALTKAGIEEFRVPLPPLSEQERIAGRLTEQLAAVERARAAAQSRLAAAQALPAAYLCEVFGASAPFSASVLRPTEPTRPGWKWHLLTDLARLATGHTPSRREPKWWGGEIPWLQLPDIRAVDGRRVTKTLEQTNELGLANSSAVLLPAGTVCMSRTASVGFVTIMGRDMATSQDFVNWVCGPDLDPDFLMYLMLRSRREIRALGSGATHHSIYFETVEDFSVCVPPVEDQKRIAADLSRRLAGAERLARRAADELAAIDALPAVLLREAFSTSESQGA